MVELDRAVVEAAEEEQVVTRLLAELVVEQGAVEVQPFLLL
jgi:hypothetical protein